MRQIRNEPITIKKCDQLKNQLLVAIEVENKLTKVLFLNKTNKEQLLNDDETSLVLELNFFLTEDFEYAIEWIRDNAYLPDYNRHCVHITGSFAFEHQNKIKNILNRDVLYIDGFQAIAAGCKFAQENIGVENLLAKPVDYETFEEVENEKLTKILDFLKNKLTDKKYTPDMRQPCLFYVQGSTSALYYFDENGFCEYFDALHLGTQTFFGLSKCLLNSNDFNEMNELALHGNQNNVDTLLGEMLEGRIKSPYGQISPKIPFFPFGKGMDYNRGLESFKKEDISMSLMSFHIHNIIYVCTSVCFTKKLSKVYLCGSIFDSEVFRKQFLKLLSGPFVLIDPVILNFQEPAILGALIYEKYNDRGNIKHF